MTLTLSSSNVHFTANIFYHLLLSAMQNKRQSGDNYKGGTGKLTQTHLFYDLNVLVDTTNDNLGNFEFLLSLGKLQGSYKNAANKFKSGKFTAAKSDIYLLNDGKTTAKFDEQVRQSYSKALEKTIELANRYFTNSNENTTLVQKILYLMLHDSSIEKSQKFYICSDGSAKTKTDLKNIAKIEFEPFLLGVWHYLIVSQRLQTELKDVQEIAVDKQYGQLHINLIQSNLTAKTLVSQNSKPTQKFRKSINTSSSDYIRETTQTVCDIINSFYPLEIDQNTDIISILENNDITLSRSIFFYLLADSIQTVHPKQNKNAAEKLFLDLLNLTADNNCKIDFAESLARYCHDKFKYLKKISSADCLDNAAQISTFLSKFQTNYADMLYNMIKIRNKYFNSDTKNEALVTALIEFIRNDSSIGDNQEFYVCSDSSSLTKAQLQEAEAIEFEPFLLGIWRYVISQLNTKDSADEHTFNTVFKISYEYSGKECQRYRSGDIIAEQSELYAELIYLNE